MMAMPVLRTFGTTPRAFATHDFWNYTKGVCYSEPIDCDDQDLCTVDTCDAVHGCSNTPISNCCGEDICGTQETCSTCLQDCCEVASLLLPDYGSHSSLSGLFFDISAPGANDVAIKILTMRPASSSGTYRVLVLDEAYPSTENNFQTSANEAKYTEIASGTLPGAGSDQTFAHEIVFDSPVTIPAGGVRGFAVGTSSPSSYFKGNSHSGMQWQPFESDVDVAITHAMAVPSLFGSSYYSCYDPEAAKINYMVLEGSPSSSAPANPPTPAPVEPPTAAPSPLPSSSPTAAPTAAPTSLPSSSPTAAPSPSPTEFPTESPTAGSTESPTNEPTDLPSEAPSDEPTTAMSTSAPVAPTDEPTVGPPTPAPVEPPTAAPSPLPSSSPTAAPTAAPTSLPSSSPTAAPPPSPTEFPTESPTAGSTESPTNEPTDLPSEAPSDEPTTAMSTSAPVAPTDEPTVGPTASPTAGPTGSPTESPTSSPTASMGGDGTCSNNDNSCSDDADCGCNRALEEAEYDASWLAIQNAKHRGLKKEKITAAPSASPVAFCGCILPEPTQSPAEQPPPCLQKDESDCRIVENVCCAGLSCKGSGRCK